MWIFGSYFKGSVKLWSRERGLTESAPLIHLRLHVPKRPFSPLGDDSGLESRYRVEECSFNTIFGSFEGHRIYASRKVAEKIEKQTRYAAELYNVDVRQDQRTWPRRPLPLRRQGRVEILSRLPGSSKHPGDGGGRRSKLSQGYLLRPGPQRAQAKVRGAREGSPRRSPGVHQGPRPDVILFPYADTWVPLIVKKARGYGLEPTFSRSGLFNRWPPSPSGAMARSTQEWCHDPRRAGCSWTLPRASSTLKAG